MLIQWVSVYNCSNSLSWLQLNDVPTCASENSITYVRSWQAFRTVLNVIWIVGGSLITFSQLLTDSKLHFVVVRPVTVLFSRISLKVLRTILIWKITHSLKVFLKQSLTSSLVFQTFWVHRQCDTLIKVQARLIQLASLHFGLIPIVVSRSIPIVARSISIVTRSIPDSQLPTSLQALDYKALKVYQKEADRKMVDYFIHVFKPFCFVEIWNKN